MSGQREKLPEAVGWMVVGQAIYLELLHLLVDSGVVTEEQAVKQYEANLKKYNRWKDI